MLPPLVYWGVDTRAEIPFSIGKVETDKNIMPLKVKLMSVGESRNENTSQTI